MRIDKFLWFVRIYKTRSIATEACRSGKVLIDNQVVKPSREVKLNEIVEVKKMPVLYRYKVKQLLKSRVGAKLVNEYIEDITPREELDKLKIQQEMDYGKRDRGTGRPTKKDRRDIDKWLW